MGRRPTMMEAKTSFRKRLKLPGSFDTLVFPLLRIYERSLMKKACFILTFFMNLSMDFPD
jgi:hypothetical protein